MIKHLNIALALLCAIPVSHLTSAQGKKYNIPDEQMLYHQIPDWFEEARFGVFVHFGANGYFRYFVDKDQVVGQEMDHQSYVKGAGEITLTQEHIDHWAGLFKRWGAGYAVLTTKHRPGFALWDSKVTNRDVVDMSPGKTDMVKAWNESLRKHKIKVGLYFSHYDWGSKWFNQAKNQDMEVPEGKRQKAWQKHLQDRDAMVEELVSNYGQIDLIWWDEDWCARDYVELGSDKMLDIVFDHQPGIVINNRARHPWRWHYGTPEKYVPLKPRDTPWETCDNLTNSQRWGFVPGQLEDNYKRPEDILFSFLDVLAMGGNYLLNIGPRPDGSIPEKEIEIMDYVGTFIDQNQEAIYGTSAGLPRVCYGEASTVRRNVLYLFSYAKNPNYELTIRGVKNVLKSAVDLNTGERLPFRVTGGYPEHGNPGYIRVKVPGGDGVYPKVYKLTFEGEEIELKIK